MTDFSELKELFTVPKLTISQVLSSYSIESAIASRGEHYCTNCMGRGFMPYVDPWEVHGINWSTCAVCEGKGTR